MKRFMRIMKILFVRAVIFIVLIGWFLPQTSSAQVYCKVDGATKPVAWSQGFFSDGTGTKCWVKDPTYCNPVEQRGVIRYYRCEGENEGYVKTEEPEQQPEPTPETQPESEPVNTPPVIPEEIVPIDCSICLTDPENCPKKCSSLLEYCHIPKRPQKGGDPVKGTNKGGGECWVIWKQGEDEPLCSLGARIFCYQFYITEERAEGNEEFTKEDKVGFWANLGVNMGRGYLWFFSMLARDVAWPIILSGYKWALSPSVISGEQMYNQVAVREAWETIRNIGNIGFIFFLLFTAFGTIFRVQGWNAKSVAVKLFIAAVLLNFSMMAGELIIDASNVLTSSMYDFINLTLSSTKIRSLEKFPEYLMSALNIEEYLEKNEDARKTYASKFQKCLDNEWGAGGGIIGKLTLRNVSGNNIDDCVAVEVIGFVNVLLLDVVFGIVVVVLMLRIALFWMLLTFSPIAFLGIAFPQMKNISSKWFNILIKYAFIGPLILFLLGLAAQFIVRRLA